VVSGKEELVRKLGVDGAPFRKVEDVTSQEHAVALGSRTDKMEE